MAWAVSEVGSQVDICDAWGFRHLDLNTGNGLMLKLHSSMEHLLVIQPECPSICVNKCVFWSKSIPYVCLSIWRCQSNVSWPGFAIKSSRLKAIPFLSGSVSSKIALFISCCRYLLFVCLFGLKLPSNIDLN
jgi:hypothetical protein